MYLPSYKTEVFDHGSRFLGKLVKVIGRIINVKKRITIQLHLFFSH